MLQIKQLCEVRNCDEFKGTKENKKGKIIDIHVEEHRCYK
jgi:hypothetical protein